MRGRDIVTGLVVLVILIAGVLLIKNARDKKLAGVPIPTPSIEQKIGKTFNGLTIPNDAEKAELKDVTGGTSFGIVTRTEVLANLPELPKGQVYQVKLENPQGKTILLGSLRIAKGGYLLEYDSSKYPGYDKVLVVLGSKTLLEGSF
jgi:hypothetical protein